MASFGAAADALERGAVVVADLAHLQQLGVADEGGQRVVQFMGDASDKFADRGELFGVAQLGLGGTEDFDGFLQLRQGLLQVAGVVVGSAGLAFLVFGGRRPGRGAFLAAVGTGLTIAAYTTVDGVGVRLSASPIGYIGCLMVLQSLCVPLFAAVRRRDVLLKQPRRILLAGLAAGALSVLAYGLVLWAQTRGALAPIAALRETSVIFGAIIGTLVFREPFGRTRIIATVLVVAGIVLLNVA